MPQRRAVGGAARAEVVALDLVQAVVAAAGFPSPSSAESISATRSSM